MSGVSLVHPHVAVGHERLVTFLRDIAGKLADAGYPLSELTYFRPRNPHQLSWTSAPLDAQFVGALERLWPWLREEAARRKMWVHLTVQATLTEHATWTPAASIPLTKSHNSSHGIFSVSALGHAYLDQ